MTPTCTMPWPWWVPGGVPTLLVALPALALTCCHLLARSRLAVPTQPPGGGPRPPGPWTPVTPEWLFTRDIS